MRPALAPYGAALEVSRATPADFPTVIAILVEAAEWHEERDLHQWTPALFLDLLRDRIARQVEAGEVYLAHVAGQPAGTLTLTWSDPEVWGDDPAPAGYVHRLAIRRAYAGRGVGRAMLDWAGSRCAASGRGLLRLDTMAANTNLRAYYERLGFAFRGVNEDVPWKAARYERAVADERSSSAG